jgi:DNA-binding NarL/FixJ family response regulator
MRSQTHHAKGISQPRIRDTLSSGEVGHIVLGERLYSVIRARDLANWPESDEMPRFRLHGELLAVVDAKAEHGRPAVPAADDLVLRLTGRELEIAVLVAHGHANKNIAFQLQISEWTVATYMRRIFTKLNVENRAAMVYRCASLIEASKPPVSSRNGASSHPSDRRISV